MFVKFKNSSIIKSQSFPDSVAPLHRRVEWADPCLVAMHQLSIDVYDEVAVSFIEFLKHKRKTKQQRTRMDTKSRGRKSEVETSRATRGRFVFANRILTQPVRTKSFVTFAAAFINLSEALWHLEIC